MHRWCQDKDKWPGGPNEPLTRERERERERPGGPNEPLPPPRLRAREECSAEQDEQVVFLWTDGSVSGKREAGCSSTIVAPMDLLYLTDLHGNVFWDKKINRFSSTLGPLIRVFLVL